MRADKTKDRSPDGVVILLVGRILLAPLMNLTTQGSDARDLLKKELRADIGTFTVAGLNPLSNPAWRKSRTLAILQCSGLI